MPLDTTVPRSFESPRVSVAIATYRRPGGLKRLLEALEPQVAGIAGREVIVVNDGSHDKEYERVRERFAPILTYRPLDANAGIAVARNICAEIASGDFVVYIDDDCVPPPFWLDWLVAVLRSEPDLDVVAGTAHPLWPARRGFRARVQAHFELFPRPRQVGDDILFVTANVAIRRELLMKQGGFGFPGFAGAGEDTELCNRLMLAGANMRIDWSWYVHHDVGEPIVRLCRRFWHYGYANASSLRLTTWPWAHDDLGSARRLSILGWRTRYRELRRMADEFSPSPWMRSAGAAAATAVSMAYNQGCATANRERARRTATH